MMLELHEDLSNLQIQENPIPNSKTNLHRSRKEKISASYATQV